jgi:hypothetical protein
MTQPNSARKNENVTRAISFSRPLETPGSFV